MRAYCQWVVEDQVQQTQAMEERLEQTEDLLVTGSAEPSGTHIPIHSRWPVIREGSVERCPQSKRDYPPSLGQMPLGETGAAVA